MDHPPWTQPRLAEPPARAAQGARAFWLTVIVVAVSFAAIGIQRERIQIYTVERTNDPLVLFASGPTCGQNARARVVESPTTVTVTLTHDRVFCGGTGACAGGAEIRLQDPLGGRQVIDASTSDPVFVQDPL